MIRVTWLKDVFRPLDDADVSQAEHVEGAAVGRYLPDGFPANRPYAAIHGERCLTAAELERVEPVDGDELIFAEIPATDPGQVTLFLIYVVFAAISVASSYVAATMAPRLSSRGGQDDEGPSRTFDGIQNTTAPGTPVAFGFGEVRVGGQILQSFERQNTQDEIDAGGTTLYTLVALGWGPVESITDPEIDENPIGFTGANYEVRLGKADQAPIRGFEETVTVNEERRSLLQGDGAQEFLTGEVDGFDVVILSRGLFRTGSSGRLLSKSVDVRVLYRERGGLGVRSGGTYTLTGTTRSLYKRIIRIRGLDRAEYEIRVERLTPDDSTFPAANQNSPTEVFSIQEVIDDASSHPGIALIGFKQVPTSEFSSVPQRYTSVVKWAAKTRVYSDESTYTEEYTDNVAWCWAAFLTSRRYGFRETYEQHINLPALLDYAAWCDELVDRGDGVLEKRARIAHTFDTQLDGQATLEVFSRISGTNFARRGLQWMPLMDRIPVDPAEDPVWIATAANCNKVVEKPIQRSTRANRITGEFLDRDQNWDRRTHTEEAQGLADDEEFEDALLPMFGVYNRSQLSRELARFVLHSRLDDSQFELEATLSAYRVGAHSVIGISESLLGIGLASGRLRDVDPTGASAKLDEEVTLEAGKDYELVVVHTATDTVEAKRIVTPAGIVESVAFADADWKTALAKGALYCIGEMNGAYVKCRVTRTSIARGGARKLVATRYDAGVYSGNLRTLPTRIPSSIPNPRRFPPDPFDLTVNESVVEGQDGHLQEQLDVDWRAPVSAIIDHWEVYARESGAETWTLLASVRGEITRAAITQGIESPGHTYTITVAPVTSTGTRKNLDQLPKATITTTGITERPPDLSGLFARISGGMLIANVLPAEGLGPNGFYRWRYGAQWGGSVQVAETREPRLELRSYPQGTVVLSVKAVNAAGNESLNAATFSIALRGDINANVIVSEEHEDPWPGTWDGFSLGAGGELTLTDLAAARAPIPMVGRYRGSLRQFGYGAPDPQVISNKVGRYTTPIVTLASGDAIKFARPDVKVDLTPLDVDLGTFDSATFPFSSDKAKVPFDGAVTDEIVVVVEARFSATDTAESSFDAWTPLPHRGEVEEAKYAQFRVTITVTDERFSAQLDKVTVTIDVEDKRHFGSVSIGTASPEVVTFPAGLFQAITGFESSLQGAALGVYHRVTTVPDKDGFTVELRLRHSTDPDPAADALTSGGTVHYTAVGY